MKSFTPNSEITAQARMALSGNWVRAIGVLFVCVFLFIGILLADAALIFFLFPNEKEVSGGILSFIFSGAMAVGLASFFLSVTKGMAQFYQLFDGFNRFGRSFFSYFMKGLFLLFWTLLFVIPGVIKSYSYMMTFFVLADDPDIGPVQAITRSRELMDGNKFKLWCLQLRFFGWAILCQLTFGIGFIWLAPYVTTSMAAFYSDIKEQG